MLTVFLASALCSYTRSVLHICRLYSTSYTAKVFVNAVLSCQQSRQFPSFSAAPTFLAQACFSQRVGWLSQQVRYHTGHCERHGEAGSISALKKLPVWKEALTQNTHSHSSMTGNTTGFQRSTETGIKAKTEGSEMVHKSSAKHKAMQRSGVGGRCRQRKPPRVATAHGGWK